MAYADGVGLFDRYRVAPQKRQDFLDGPEDVSHVNPLARALTYGAFGTAIGAGFAVYVTSRKGLGHGVWRMRYPGSMSRFKRNQLYFLSTVGFISTGTVGLTSGIAAHVRRRDDRNNVRLGIMLAWIPTALMLQSPSQALMLAGGAFFYTMLLGIATIRSHPGPPNNFDTNSPEELSGPYYNAKKVIARLFYGTRSNPEDKETLEEHYEKYKTMYPEGGM